jgi:hypothetical protein
MNEATHGSVSTFGEKVAQLWERETGRGSPNSPSIGSLLQYDMDEAPDASLISVVIDMLENWNPQDSHLELQVEDTIRGAQDFMDDWSDDPQAETDVEPEADLGSNSEVDSDKVELDENAATMISHSHSSDI